LVEESWLSRVSAVVLFSARHSGEMADHWEGFDPAFSTAQSSLTENPRIKPTVRCEGGCFGGFSGFHSLSGLPSMKAHQRSLSFLSGMILRFGSSGV
jgi:hypothetical protein